MITPSVQASAAFDPQRFQPVTLAQTAQTKTMLVCLEPGQAIPVHGPPVDLTLVILEGRATLVCGEQELSGAGPGAVLQAEAGQRRGLKAEVRTIALAVVSPPPTAQDHREVADHLKKGTWQ